MKLIVLAVAAFLLYACAEEDEPTLDPLEISEIDGDTLWKRITDEAPYTAYSFWPTHEGIRPGQAPHGEYHRIYINRVLRESLPLAEAAAPEGTIIVKDSLDASRELVSITVMAKIGGYAPDSGDWFWAHYTPDGTVRASGAVNGCISCHAGMSDNDYIIVRRLDASIE